MLSVLVVFFLVLSRTRLQATLDVCKADCAKAERLRLCPVRDAPVQIFDGSDGMDLEFDLMNFRLNMTSCSQTNASSLSWHWRKQSGQGYSVRGEKSLAKVDDSLDAKKELNISNKGFAHLDLLENGTSLFHYYGMPIRSFYIYDFGGILLSPFAEIEETSFSFDTSSKTFLRSVFWPHLFLCPLCTNAKSTKMKIYSQFKRSDSDDEALALSFAPNGQVEYEAVFHFDTGSIQFNYGNNVSSGRHNATFIVGLSHGIVPEWKALAYDSLDLSSTDQCLLNLNCTVEENVRPFGRTRPPNTRKYPFATAPSFNPHPQFCELGCSFYYLNWTLSGCKASCDTYYNYDMTCAYNDRAEMARYECYDGCELGNARCQPGFYCFQGIMQQCPPGTYRDLDYYHVTQCDDCSHGRYRETVAGRNLDACDSCSVGRYLPYTGSTSRYECTLCPPGRFANEPGMQKCKCITQIDANFEYGLDQSVIYPECGPEDYLDDSLRPALPSIDWSPRTTYP